MAKIGDVVTLFQNETPAGAGIVTAVDDDGNADVCQLVASIFEVRSDPTDPHADEIVISTSGSEAAIVPDVPAETPATEASATPPAAQ